MSEKPAWGNEEFRRKKFTSSVVTAEISPENPPKANVVNEGNALPFLIFTLENKEESPVFLKELKIKGEGDDFLLESLSLRIFDDSKQYQVVGNFSEKIASLDFSDNPLRLEAKEKRTFTLSAGIDPLSTALNPGYSASLFIASGKNIFFTDKWGEESIIKGNFPLQGNKQTLVLKNEVEKPSRGLILDLVIKAYYGNSLVDLSHAFADKDNPTFLDAPANHEYFEAIEIANGLDILNGYSDGKFLPDTPLTRAEVVKIIHKTAELPTVITPLSSYTDIETSGLYYDHITSFQNLCIFEKNSPLFLPNDIAGNEFHVWLERSIRVYDGEYLCDDNMNPIEGSIRILPSYENPSPIEIPLGGKNIFFLAFDLQNNSNHPISPKNISFKKEGSGLLEDIKDVALLSWFDYNPKKEIFEAGSSIINFDMTKNAFVLNPGDTRTFYLYASLNPKSSTTLVGEKHSFVLENIGATSTKTGENIDVIGDFPVFGNTMTTIIPEESILNFDFRALSNNILEVGSSDVKLAHINIKSIKSDAFVKKIRLGFHGIEDRVVGNIYLESQGRRISNIVPFLQNSEVILNLTENYSFVSIKDGGNQNIYLRGDILTGTGQSFEVSFDQVSTDVDAVDLPYELPISPTTTFDSVSSRTITIQGGNILFDIDSEMRNVSPYTDNVEFGVLSIFNKGEAFKFVSDVFLRLDVEAPDNSDTNFNVLRDVRLVDIETGITLFGPIDPDNKTILAGTKRSTALRFPKDTIVEEGQFLNLSIQADVMPGAINDSEYSFTLVMHQDDAGETSALPFKIQGLTSGKIENSGIPTTGNFTIRPETGPSTKIYSVVKPSIIFTPKSLRDDTFVRGTSNVVVWRSSIRANQVSNLIVRSLSFENIYTDTTGVASPANEDDIFGFSLYKKEGDDLIVLEELKSFDAQTTRLSFGRLNKDGEVGILIPSGSELDLVLMADTTSNAQSNKKIQMALRRDDTRIEDERGSDAFISELNFLNSSWIPLSEGESGGILPTKAIFSLADSGFLFIRLDARTPKSVILTAGTGLNGPQAYVPTGIFRFESLLEAVRIENLTVSIEALNDIDGIAASKAVNAVSLFYYNDGTIVKKQTGQEALVSNLGEAQDEYLKGFDSARVGVNGLTISNAFFQDLDLVIQGGTNNARLIESRVAINEMGIQTASAKARSGMKFRTALQFNPFQTQDDTISRVQGVSSGDILGPLQITIEGENGGDTATPKDPQRTNPGNAMYVFNEKVIIEKSFSQSTALSTGGATNEILKFDAKVSGTSGNSPFINTVFAEITVSGSDANNPISLGTPELYNGDGTKIAEGENIAGNTYKFEVGLDSAGFPLAGLPSDIKTIGIKKYDPIDENETYVLRSVINGVLGDNDRATATIFVNNSEPRITPNTAGIIWRDTGASGTGADSTDVHWINLRPHNTSTTQIENILR